MMLLGWQVTAEAATDVAAQLETLVMAFCDEVAATPRVPKHLLARVETLRSAVDAWAGNLHGGGALVLAA